MCELLLKYCVFSSNSIFYELYMYVNDCMVLAYSIKGEVYEY